MTSIYCFTRHTSKAVNVRFLLRINYILKVILITLCSTSAFSYTDIDKRCSAESFLDKLVDAQAGNSDAQLALGLLYANCPKEHNFKDALYWYKKSAEQNNLNAIAIVFEYYFDGRGVAKNYKEAFSWAEKGALLGDVKLQNHLTLMYLRGMGVKASDLEAFKWAKIASEQGDATAHARLAVLYSMGKGVRLDLVKAYMHATIADKRGNVSIWKLKNDIEKELNNEQTIRALKLANLCEIKQFKNC